MEQILFARETKRTAPIHDMKSNLESRSSERITCLTIGQRCVDWFTMRQFRTTGTNAGIFLLRSSDVL